MYRDDPRLIYVGQTRAKFIHLNINQYDFQDTNNFKELIKQLPDHIVSKSIHSNLSENQDNASNINKNNKHLLSSYKDDLISINSYLNVEEKYKRNTAVLIDVILTKDHHEKALKIVLS